jgi:glycosyltransferase involved in cell wall biosynthesis
LGQLNGQLGIGGISRIDLFKSPLRYERVLVGNIAMPQTGTPSGPVITQPKVAILLCTYHGQHYLAEQLDSFVAQAHSNWEVWASDDGSNDDTRTILETYQQKWPSGQLSVNVGPAEGFAANFLSLTSKASINADHYAYSDQDDIWEPNKLARAVKWLESLPENIPGLYCSRTRLVDSHNNEVGISPLFAKPPSFANALIQNIAGGNTMVFNNAARNLLREAGENLPVITHDWWAYMVVTGCGGQVFYDTEPTLRYRQHDSNLIGINSTWSARFKRIRMLWRGQFRGWNDSNIAALRMLSQRLTPENLEILEHFTRARTMSLIPRLIHFKRSGIYRQTLLGNFGLFVAAVFRKL